MLYDPHHKSAPRKRLRRWLMLALAVWCVLALCLCGVIYAYGKVDRAQTADVIIVLGAGLERDNRPGPALTRRANHAAELWKRVLAPAIICTGGITGRENTRSEASACSELLRAAGVPEEDIVLEDRSRSTEENAIYANQIMQAHGWHSALLVSDSFHLFRANWLFNQRGITVYPSPVMADQVNFLEYLVATAREIGALHWQVLKELLNLPYTSVTGV
jgi:uncharacterized SAM-binding protein YcdF (DUF218 family)